MYVKVNGVVFDDDGLTDPAPFSVMLTFVALPPKVLPLTIKAVTPQVLPDVLLRVTVGGFTHPHDTSKLLPVVMHPVAFLTLIVCVPLATPVKLVLDWYAPPSRLYSNPAPVGLVTVITALPKPREQSIVCVGLVGEAGCAFMTTFADDTEIHPEALVNV